MATQEFVCSCGVEVGIGAKFCGRCGTPVSEQRAHVSATLAEGILDALEDDGPGHIRPTSSTQRSEPIGFELAPPVGEPVDVRTLGIGQILAPPDSSTVLIPAVPAEQSAPGPAAGVPAPPTADELEARRLLTPLQSSPVTAGDAVGFERRAQRLSPRTRLGVRLRGVRSAALVGLRRPRTWIVAVGVTLLMVGGTFGYRWISDPRRSELYEEISVRAAELRAEHESLEAKLASTRAEAAAATELRDRVVAAREARDALLDEIAASVRAAENAKRATVRLEATLERYRRGDFD